MKRTIVLAVALVSAGLILLAGVRAIRAQDPVVVNPKLVHVTLENEHVRVLEALLQPGEKEQLHSHPASVVYILAGGKIRNHSADGKTTETELVTGATLYRAPSSHWAENIGSTPIHLILVELKDHH